MALWRATRPAGPIVEELANPSPSKVMFFASTLARPNAPSSPMSLSERLRSCSVLLLNSVEASGSAHSVQAQHSDEGCGAARAQSRCRAQRRCRQVPALIKRDVDFESRADLQSCGPNCYSVLSNNLGYVPVYHAVFC